MTQNSRSTLHHSIGPRENPNSPQHGRPGIGDPRVRGLRSRTDQLAMVGVVITPPSPAHTIERSE